MLKESNNILTRENVYELSTSMRLNSLIDIDFLYDVYLNAIGAIKMMQEANSLAVKNRVNHIELLHFCIGELLYTIEGKDKNDVDELYVQDELKEEMGTISADKYLTLSQYETIDQNSTNKYLPPSSSLNIYLNFMLNILSSYEKNDPQSTLIRDLLTKSLLIARCILTDLTHGYETEAFSSWRTLHECECTLIILEKYGGFALDSYLKHMNYGLAFKNQIENKAKQDEIFYAMKDEMKKYQLKSKDIKKYIEYGWLYSIPGVKLDEQFKLNFRDGLERIAGLSSYSKTYELSSEIIHSTPLLIYSNKRYFYYVALLNVYESFFRLEKVFVSLFAKRVDETVMKQYLAMRDIYFTQLLTIHKREKLNFSQLNK